MRQVFAIATFLTMSLTGCGVTLDAKRVTVGQQIEGDGIVYALPRTEFEIVQPIKLKFSTAGGLRDTYDTCKRACDAEPNYVGPDCTFDTTAKVLYAPPELRTTAVPDYSQLYQVRPSADAFQSLNFKFEIASNGVLDKVDASATNTGFEVVSNVASTVLKVAMAPSAAVAQHSKSLIAGKSNRTCYQTSSDIADLLKKGTGPISCPLVSEVDACLDQFEKSVQAEQKSVNDIFDKAQNGSLRG